MVPRVGDVVRDVYASRWQHAEVLATVTKVDGERFVVDNLKFRHQFPQSFYLSDLGAKWELVND